MKDLKKLINDRIEEFSKSGKFTEQIDKQIENMFRDLMKDVFSSWGEPVKQLKQSILEQLQLEHLKLDIPSYNKLIANIVKAEMEGSQVTHMKERAAEVMKELFNPLGKHYWKLSEIIEEFKKTLYDSGEITLIVDWSDGITGAGTEFCHIYFDEQPNQNKYACSYCLNTMTHKIKGKDGGEALTVDKVWGGTISRIPVKDIKTPVLGQFDNFMFQLIAEEVIIEIDEDYTDKEYHEYEED